jgi:hypothetical protein
MPPRKSCLAHPSRCRVSTRCQSAVAEFHFWHALTSCVELSDDERSESEVRDAPKAVAAPADYKVKSKQVTMEDEEEESLMIESGGNGEDEDDEIGEDEFVFLVWNLDCGLISVQICR